MCADECYLLLVAQNVMTNSEEINCDTIQCCTPTDSPCQPIGVVLAGVPYGAPASDPAAPRRIDGPIVFPAPFDMPGEYVMFVCLLGWFLSTGVPVYGAR